MKAKRYINIILSCNWPYPNSKRNKESNKEIPTTIGPKVYKLRKSNDSIYLKAVIEALIRQGIYNQYIETLVNIYKEVMSGIKIQKDTPESILA